MIDVLEIKDFLNAAMREEIISELRLAGGVSATVYGKEEAGAVDPRIRKATQLAVSPETRERVMRQLLDRKREIGEHFGITLGECEEPQFLRYKTGDFFVAHQDGNTPLIHDQSRFRKISIIILLSQQSTEATPDTYGGGALLFHGPFPNYDFRLSVTAGPATLVAFRSETTHEVVPVTHGKRYSIASWYR